LITDDDHACCDAGADFELLLYRHVQLADGFDHLQATPDCTIGIILMRLGIAEADHHTVAQILSDRPIVPANNIRAAFVIGANDDSNVFSVKTDRERRRANQITE
jgi:hypothetical protein